VSAQPPLGLENVSKKFQIFHHWAKKISLARVKKYSDQSQISPLITADQKYARDGVFMQDINIR